MLRGSSGLHDLLLQSCSKAKQGVLRLNLEQESHLLLSQAQHKAAKIIKMRLHLLITQPFGFCRTSVAVHAGIEFAGENTVGPSFLDGHLDHFSSSGLPAPLKIIVVVLCARTQPHLPFCVGMAMRVCKTATNLHSQLPTLVNESL